MKRKHIKPPHLLSLNSHGHTLKQGVAMSNQINIFGNTGGYAHQGSLFKTRKSVMKDKDRNFVQAHNQGLKVMDRKKKAKLI